MKECCLTCQYFVSFFDDYEDPEEPKNQGFCKNYTGNDDDGSHTDGDYYCEHYKQSNP